MDNAFRKLIFSALIIFATIFISSCGSNNELIPTSPPKEIIPVSEPLPPFEKIESDVYFDATVSMQGYTKLDAGNVYRALPDSLNDICGRMGGVKFYSFGEKIKPLKEREYRRFSSPEPYVETVTSIYNVIDKSDPARLSIIVTDLFENDADWSSIAQKIREKYFASNLAAAVVGIKNSFNGEIFDVGFNAAKFRYDSNISPERFRPFYLLVLGQEEAVQKFIQLFKERQTLPNETEYLLLSKNLVPAVSNFSDATAFEPVNFFVNEKFKFEENPEYDGVQEFGLDSFSAPASLTIHFYYKEPFATCPLNLRKVNSSAKIFYLNDGEWTARNKNDVQVELTPAEGTENSYIAKLELTPEKSLAEEKINFVQILISPAAKTYQLPDWVSAWNMDELSANFDGSKTANLVQMLSSLKDSAVDSNNSALVNLKFVVDVP